MSDKIIPKLDVDKIHNAMKLHFGGFRYFILSENKVDDELYVMTNMQKQKVIDTLTELIESIKTNKGVHNVEVSELDLKKFSKNRHLDT